MGSCLVALRLFDEASKDNDWKDVPVASYMPMFLGPDGNTDNINRRIFNMYLKSDPNTVKIRWNIKGDDENGHWVTKDIVFDTPVSV